MNFQNTKTGEIRKFTVSQILEEINRDRSAEWTDYKKHDWRDGLEWIEWRVSTWAPLMTKKSQSLTGDEKPIFKDCLFDGIIGGFTFADGHKSKIYQCGECGALLEYNSNYNEHKKTIHGFKDSVEFGWADGEPDWQELDIKEADIL